MRNVAVTLVLAGTLHASGTERPATKKGDEAVDLLIHRALGASSAHASLDKSIYGKASQLAIHRGSRPAFATSRLVTAQHRPLPLRARELASLHRAEPATALSEVAEAPRRWTSRRDLLLGAAAAAVAVAAPAHAGLPAALSASPLEKQRGLSAKELAAIVQADIDKRQFLVTGDITRSIYDESCTFKDEIDTYTLEKWVKGTSALFAGDCSHVDIVGPITADESTVRFRFSETLTFKVPPLYPYVPLTGELVLVRGPDGLITSYKEIWDDQVPKVLQNVKLFGCKA
eukprot:gnl/TRDRNA2_/TRDRNA2_150217_c0_seq1.p1 gnl/TRDRNA2_/TRDRNA2_150217_c0~~gnl/TRDRNA2_/TRDRNA2_150217_c0_seq1.p1  ORF type:complete len:287 (-),score=52.73 gnl/TRDRNA2_/TRDRNA2_150217_c0_seq1:121-981(-)